MNAFWLLTSVFWASQSDPGVEFFERRIRPLLAEKCYACHDAKATSGLRLDSRAGWTRGGTRGSALVPGQAEASLLIRAISYEDPRLSMPPTGKLTPEQIADLTRWVEMGAPDPRQESAPVVVTSIDFEKGKQFWSLRPIQRPAPPAVSRKSWPASPIDNFLLARLEQKGLTPAPPADRRTLIRRVTFDLIGLPPSPQEVEAFVNDRSPDAFRTVVERLLASPHYGERWARHWLDLVRFGETTGHEFDSEKPDAWRYRDYAIRAFNEDVPYDRLIEEHLAGDLVERAPRLAAGGTLIDSPLGTGFFGLHEERNAADDVAEVAAENVDNQIDVLSKSFLGLTVACARCHDHKFDPIPTSDYYAMAGILYSTRQTETQIDTPAQRGEIEAAHRRIGEINERARPLLFSAWQAAFPRVYRGLMKPDEAWRAVLDRARNEPDHVLHPFAVLAQPSPEPFRDRLKKLRESLEAAAQAPPREGDIVFADFSRGSYDGWTVHGPAFGERPWTSAPPNQALAGHQGGALANSFGLGSNELTGVLVSKSFPVTRRFVHVRMAGTVDKTRRREFGALRFTVQIAGRPAFLNADQDGVFQWKTASLRLMEGQICHFVIADRSRGGWIAVDKVVLSNDSKPPVLPPHPLVAGMLGQPWIGSLEDLASAYTRMFREAAEGALATRDAEWLLAALDPAGRWENLAALLPESERRPIEAIQKLRAEAEAAMPQASYGPASSEDIARDVPIAIRGNLANLGAVVPRGFLRVLDGSGDPAFREGSGRLALARAIARRDNPLAARVMVNRIWKHHFGEGLVRTVDNFGRTGERPSHPELLDLLASRFIDSGWSVKAMHRLMVLSAAYRMSSQPTPAAAQLDPDNRLLHHMRVRRLEAETIRDSMLLVSGTLDRTLFGPSIVPHISPYQDGRGKPASGPLDADGRRSIYIQVRRNFLTPLLLAFDYPLPVTTIGRRGATTVPSQALMMMNNEFVAQQAGKWAGRQIAAHSDPRRRVEAMFLEAFARAPQPAEAAEVLSFVERQARLYPESKPDDPRPWADAAHVLMNSKEFIFIR